MNVIFKNDVLSMYKGKPYCGAQFESGGFNCITYVKKGYEDKEEDELFEGIFEGESCDFSLRSRMYEQSDCVWNYDELRLIVEKNVQKIFDYMPALEYVFDNKPIYLCFFAPTINGSLMPATAGSMATNGECVRINPFFIDYMMEMTGCKTKDDDGNYVYNDGAFDSPEFQFVFMHELFHCYYNHPEEGKERAAEFPNPQLQNHSMDHQINIFIEQWFPIFKGMTRKLGGVIDESGIFMNEHWTYIYDQIDDVDTSKDTSAMDEINSETEDDEDDNQQSQMPQPPSPPGGGGGGGQRPPMSNDEKSGYNDMQMLIREIWENSGVDPDDIESYRRAKSAMIKTLSNPPYNINMGKFLNESIANIPQKLSNGDYNSGVMQSIQEAIEKIDAVLSGNLEYEDADGQMEDELLSIDDLLPQDPSSGSSNQPQNQQPQQPQTPNTPNQPQDGGQDGEDNSIPEPGGETPNQPQDGGQDGGDNSIPEPGGNSNGQPQDGQNGNGNPNQPTTPIQQNGSDASDYSEEAGENAADAANDAMNQPSNASAQQAAGAASEAARAAQSAADKAMEIAEEAGRKASQSGSKQDADAAKKSRQDANAARQAAKEAQAAANEAEKCAEASDQASENGDADGEESAAEAAGEAAAKAAEAARRAAELAKKSIYDANSSQGKDGTDTDQDDGGLNSKQAIKDRIKQQKEQASQERNEKYGKGEEPTLKDVFSSMDNDSTTSNDGNNAVTMLDGTPEEPVNSKPTKEQVIRLIKELFEKAGIDMDSKEGCGRFNGVVQSNYKISEYCSDIDWAKILSEKINTKTYDTYTTVDTFTRENPTSSDLMGSKWSRETFETPTINDVTFFVDRSGSIFNAPNFRSYFYSEIKKIVSTICKGGNVVTVRIIVFDDYIRTIEEFKNIRRPKDMAPIQDFINAVAAGGGTQYIPVFTKLAELMVANKGKSYFIIVTDDDLFSRGYRSYTYDVLDKYIIDAGGRKYLKNKKQTMLVCFTKHVDVNFGKGEKGIIFVSRYKLDEKISKRR